MKVPSVPAEPRNSFFGFLASLKFALVVVLLITLACVAGTVVPQGAQQVAAFLMRHPEARPVMNVLSGLGLTRVFYSWWFVVLLFIFAASLTACTARRYAMIRRTSGATRVRVIGSFVTHVSLILVLAGGVVRVLWGQKGVIQLHEGEIATQAENVDAPIILPFSVRLAKFELELHENPASPAGSDKLHVQWMEKDLHVDFPVELNVEHFVIPADTPPGAEPVYKVTVLRYVPDFAFDGASGEVKSRSDEPNNPAVQVSVAGDGTTNTQWVFARFPDFGGHAGAAPMPLKFNFEAAQNPMTRGPQAPIKAFKSTLEVLEGGSVVATRTIAVNSPFSHRGYTFYQLSYDPNDLKFSALQVVKDPGVPIVYGGFILMMAGLALVFCVGPWLGSQAQTQGGIV
jgi:cytochrome c biogenesis protein ResB